MYLTVFSSIALPVLLFKGVLFILVLFTGVLSLDFCPVTGLLAVLFGLGISFDVELLIAVVF